jgi:hypothetical protein
MPSVLKSLSGALMRLTPEGGSGDWICALWCELKNVANARIVEPLGFRLGGASAWDSTEVLEVRRKTFRTSYVI